MIPKGLITKAASNQGRSNPLSGFFDFLGLKGLTNLQASLAIRYYLSAAPVASAIDKIAEPFSEIEPVVMDTKTNEFITDHPVLELLKNPNPKDSTESFQQALATWFLINGEVYPIVTANNPTSEPLEIFLESAGGASLQPFQDGFLGAIQFGTDQNTEIYTRAANELGGSFRYYNKFEDGEAWQIKRFNPNEGTDNFRGTSKLQPIMSEIEQYLESSTHNLSILMRGARPSGAIIAKDELDDGQFERLREQIDNWFSGSANAGRPLLLDGGDGMEYKEMMMSNRDMDFLKLKENVTESIFNKFDIPLALVSPKSMTLDNLKVAKLSLFDDAVVPLANRLYGELTMMLMPRYKNSENQIITFNPTTIPALETRRVENIKLRKDIGANTINEMRTLLGDEALKEGGDVVLQPATLIPIGMDAFTDDQLEKPRKKEMSQYEQLLRSQKDQDGICKFTEEEIQTYIHTYFQE